MQGGGHGRYLLEAMPWSVVSRHAVVLGPLQLCSPHLCAKFAM